MLKSYSESKFKNSEKACDEECRRLVESILREYSVYVNWLLSH